MLDYKNPDLVLPIGKEQNGVIHWKTPSNLALIKYWGKYGRQLPQNPSISLTLQNAYTDTKMTYAIKEAKGEVIDLDFYFEGKANPAFSDKLVRFLESITDTFPFLYQVQLKIESHNSFPHSAGIASSASSMGALALCLCSLEQQLFGNLNTESAFLQKASFVARLGSGSACRSLYPVIAIWGKNDDVAAGSNLYAIPYRDSVHSVFHSFHDDILIASRGEKSVSSRAGHALMEGNIYSANRYTQARQRFSELMSVLKAGDIDRFGEITENEALTLHALMMTSEPSYILMRPNTLQMIESVRAFRQETKHPLYFSLDAGPNLHLLYPDAIKSQVKEFIQSDLVAFCEDGEVIDDQVGMGPTQVKEEA